MRRVTRLLTGTLLATLALAAQAADSVIDQAKSSIVATFKQEGVAVDAPFKTFSGRIAFDPANPATANIAVDVDTASFHMDDDSYNAEVRGKAWLDSATYPKATFRSTGIKQSAPGRYDATGTLTVKGKAQTITVPITMQTAGGSPSFDGSFPLSRKAFGIGDPDWNDVLEDIVKVKFHLVAKQP